MNITEKPACPLLPNGSPHLHSPGGWQDSLHQSATPPPPQAAPKWNRTEDNVRKLWKGSNRNLILTPPLIQWCRPELAKEGYGSLSPGCSWQLWCLPGGSQGLGGEWDSWSSVERSIIILKKEKQGERERGDGYVREGGRDLRPIIFLQNTLCDNSGSPQRAACNNRA